MAMTTVTFILLPLAVVFALTGFTQSFNPLTGTSITHRNITLRAIVRKTAEVCRDIAAADGMDFTLTIDDSLTLDQVFQACTSSDSQISSFLFTASIVTLYLNNAAVDLRSAGSPEAHFDNETFQNGRNLITQGVSAVRVSVGQRNFITARASLGQALHTLQDFYSHSNWVELGNTAPYNALIRPDQPLENLAGPAVPTCRNCTGDDCTDNILPSVQEGNLLTSGYFSLISSEKPEGKCSHGGFFDRTSTQDPVGGINKDTFNSSHGSLHQEAADLAVSATVDLLQDIRISVGDQDFLRLMGLTSSSVLCFVIDTTGSMFNEIEEAKRVSISIIESRRGTEREPPFYILVPFNDPEVGPLILTTDADIFIENINMLTASGGGDFPEFSLSGLQLALTAAPPYSEIFLFTDATAKDADLRGTIIALIESTKSVVTFLLTDVLSRRRKRGLVPTGLSEGAQVYRDLALVSGGVSIEVTELDLPMATMVIEDSLASAVVTVFQAVRNPGMPDNFTVVLDDSLRNITIFITGAPSLTFNLTSSSGISQSSDEFSGPLASLISTGNLRRLQLNNDNATGQWLIQVDSNDCYSVKVTGQSSVNFIYELLQNSEGIHGDFFRQEGRALSGGNVSLLVTVTGSDVIVNEITLYDTSLGTEVNGTLQSIGDSTFLVTFNDLPAGSYVVRLRGEQSSSMLRMTPGSFQRQASTQITTSSISVTAQPNTTNIEPGSTVSILFTVATTIGGVINETATETFMVRANNDRSFDSTSPSSVTIEAGSGGKANGTVTLTAPESAISGTDVTLTIEAEDATGTDFNNVVLRFSVFRVNDVSAPVCQEANTSNSCPSNTSLCDSSQWEFMANVTDGVNGTGVDMISVLEGNGTLNTSIVVGPDGENITLVFYMASCCAESVVLSAVDNEGNVGFCVGQARMSDIDPNAPVCQEVSTSSTCPSLSSSCDIQWEFVANVTDGINGTGIESITILEGNGTLTTSMVMTPGGENLTMVSYMASCCADRVVLSAVDNEGNIGLCVGQARELTATTTATTTTTTPESTNTTTDGGQTLTTSYYLFVTSVALSLWKAH